MTSVRDIEMAVEAGADAVGIILADSPRRVDHARLAELVRAVPPMVEAVAVLVDPSDADASVPLGLGCTLQFSGNETAKTCETLSRGRPYIKAFHVDEAPVEPVASLGAGFENALWMFDTRIDGRHGGTGVSFPWHLVLPAAAVRPIVMSGGLTPENVEDCVRRVRPYAVDVRSGVETNGSKDFEKIRAFVRAVRAADAGFVRAN